MKPDILLYTTSWCPFCRRAKALLTEKGVQWTEHDIESDPAHRKTMINPHFPSKALISLS